MHVVLLKMHGWEFLGEFLSLSIFVEYSFLNWLAMITSIKETSTFHLENMVDKQNPLPINMSCDDYISLKSIVR